MPLAELAEAMKDDWMAGQADGSYEISGKCPAGFWQSAQGTIRVESADAFFPHVSMAGHEDRLRASQFSAEASRNGGTIEIEDGTSKLRMRTMLSRERLPLPGNLISGLPAQAALATPSVGHWLSRE